MVVRAEPSLLVLSLVRSTQKCPLFSLLERQATLVVCASTWRNTTCSLDRDASSYPLGAVLADLVGAFPDLDVTALVRNPQHFNALKSLGVKVIPGSFSDTDIITSNARAADITLNIGDSDDIALTEAILAGQRARVAEDHKPPAALLHTSGVAVFADPARDGKHEPNAKVWNVRTLITLYNSVCI